MTDAPFVRTHPADLPPGEIGLAEALRALTGVRAMLVSAGRTELQGARAMYTGNHPIDVNRLLDEVRLGPTKPGSFQFTFRVNIAPPAQQALLPDSGRNADPLARRTLERLFRSVSAAWEAVAAVQQGRDYSVFDEVIEAGVSANLCRGLGDLGGAGRRQPFEIGFRWARAVRSVLPPATVQFTAGAGVVIHEAAKQLEQLAAGGRARITGLIESLHDEPQGDDRWRVQVRGELTADRGELDTRRPVWVRLDAAGYQRAIDAHREHRRVQAEGELRLVRRRVELFPGVDGLAVLP